MKIFAIRDETDPASKDIAFLIYCRNKLHLIKATPKNKLFLKSEIIQRNWK